jgi:hypothetical protein
MKFTIKNVAPMKSLDENKKLVLIEGYAFIDEEGRTIIQGYGRARKEQLSKYLSADGDVLGMKYRYVDLKKK